MARRVPARMVHVWEVQSQLLEGLHSFLCFKAAEQFTFLGLIYMQGVASMCSQVVIQFAVLKVIVHIETLD